MCLTLVAVGDWATSRGGTSPLQCGVLDKGLTAQRAEMHNEKCSGAF